MQVYSLTVVSRGGLTMGGSEVKDGADMVRVRFRDDGGGEFSGMGDGCYIVL